MREKTDPMERSANKMSDRIMDNNYKSFSPNQTFATGPSSYEWKSLNFIDDLVFANSFEEKGSQGVVPTKMYSTYDRYPTHTHNTTIPTPIADIPLGSRQKKPSMKNTQKTHATALRARHIQANSIYWFGIFSILASIVWMAYLIT